MLRLLTSCKWIAAIMEFKGTRLCVAETFDNIKWSYYVETVNSKLMCVTYADGTVEDMFPASNILAYKI